MEMRFWVNSLNSGELNPTVKGFEILKYTVLRRIAETSRVSLERQCMIIIVKLIGSLGEC